MGAAKDLVSFCLAGRLAGPPPLPVPVPSESKYIHGSLDHARCAAPGGALTRKPGGQKQQHWDTAADSQICCCIARLLGTFWNSTTGKRLLPRCTKRDPGCSACRCGQPGTWGFGVVRPCSRPPPLHPLQCSRWQPPSCRRRRCYHPRAPPPPACVHCTRRWAERKRTARPHHTAATAICTHKNTTTPKSSQLPDETPLLPRVRLPQSAPATDNQSSSRPIYPAEHLRQARTRHEGNRPPSFLISLGCATTEGDLVLPILHQTSSAASTSIEEDSQSSSRVLARNGEPSVVPGARRPE